MVIASLRRCGAAGLFRARQPFLYELAPAIMMGVLQPIGFLLENSILRKSAQSSGKAFHINEFFVSFINIGASSLFCGISDNQRP